MNTSLTEALVTGFPDLYADYNQPMTQSCMAWGFECGDGWFNLIDELSAKLEPLGAAAVQVKEKYGGLRYYCHAPTKTATEVFELVNNAEDESLKICELCGRPGETLGGGWLKTRCEECK